MGIGGGGRADRACITSSVLLAALAGGAFVGGGFVNGIAVAGAEDLRAVGVVDCGGGGFGRACVVTKVATCAGGGFGRACVVTEVATCAGGFGRTPWATRVALGVLALGTLPGGSTCEESLFGGVLKGISVALACAAAAALASCSVRLVVTTGSSALAARRASCLAFLLAATIALNK